MGTKNYAVAEIFAGEFHQGFKSPEEAEKYVHKRLDEKPQQDYEFKLVEVLAEWSSDSLLPGER